MSKNITTFLFFVISIVVFFAWTNPWLKEVGLLKEERESLNKTLENFAELQGMRDRVLEGFNSISPEDSSRLSKLIPEGAEQTELMVELSNLADASGVIISRLNVQPEVEIAKVSSFSALASQALPKYKKVNLDLVCSSSYEGFISFLKGLQGSLRLVDIDGIEFSSKADGLYEFNIKAISYFRNNNI
ncbi:hypothetical protein KKA27_02480 [Patescibacteria group bacterium]|nr:hypothetical protein [Patescibacteria group bacterium]MBU2633192.1 hypothetical protein [Patescibacteria group bacterium]